MNNKSKSGFSLAEILIAMGIISVVATLGFSISKKSIESAYNQYFHTGYTGIHLALTDAQYKATEDASDTTITDKVVIGNDAWAKYIAEDLFGGTFDSTNKIINAPNNITYKIYTINSSTNEYRIEMHIPGANGKKTVNLYYLPDKYEFLILDSSYQNRIDLFPFYIDDGIKGRIRHILTDDGAGNYTFSSTPQYEKRKFYSFKDAFCKVKPGVKETINSTDIIDCSTVTTTAELGAIRLANPKNVF